MIKIEIITVGIFREMTRKSKFHLEIEERADSELTVNEVLDLLDSQFEGKIKKEVFLEDGSRNQWIRILLNGWDTRFLADRDLTVRNGDTLLISSVLIGG